MNQFFPRLAIFSAALMVSPVFAGPPSRIPNTQLILTAENPDLPQTLSDFPALFQAASGAGDQIPGVVYYEPASILFSDFAHKERYLAIPGTEQMSYQESGGFDMPEGTIVVKNFLLPIDERDPENSLKRIETRVMLFESDSWQFVTYEWNEEETDASRVNISGNSRDFTLTDSGGIEFDFTWDYPTRLQCLQCHTAAANRTLGINTAALNSTLIPPGETEEINQFESLRDLGYFSNAPVGPVDQLPALADYSDETETLENRFKAYVASNCSMCHQPGGGTPVNMDLRWEIPVQDMNIVDVDPMRGDLGFTDPKRVNTLKPMESILTTRMQSLDNRVQMPPFARNRIDQQNVDVILEWIDGLRTEDLFLVR